MDKQYMWMGGLCGECEGEDLSQERSRKVITLLASPQLRQRADRHSPERGCVKMNVELLFSKKMTKKINIIK